MLPPRLSHPDRKSTRLNSSHLVISYAVFCLKKKPRKQVARGSGFVKSIPNPLVVVGFIQAMEELVVWSIGYKEAPRAGLMAVSRLSMIGAPPKTRTVPYWTVLLS